MSEIIKYDVETCKFRLRRDDVEMYCSYMHAKGKNCLVKAYDFLERMLNDDIHAPFISDSGDLHVKYTFRDDDGQYREPIKSLVVSPDDYIVVVYKQRIMNSDEFEIDHLVSLDSRGFHSRFCDVISIPKRRNSPREAAIWHGGRARFKIDTERAFDILCYLSKGGFSHMVQAFQITPSGIEQLLRHNYLYKKINISRPRSQSEVIWADFECVSVPGKFRLAGDVFSREKYEKYGDETIVIAVTVDNVTWFAGNDDVLMFGDINEPIKGFSREEFNKFMRSGKAPANIKVYN